MGFTPASLARKRAALSEELARAADDYFARPWPEDEVPPIDGDPFTDSQEYPSRFALGAAAVEGDVAEVPVAFDDGARRRVVVYRLRRRDGAWRVDDLRYEGGSSLRELLR